MAQYAACRSDQHPRLDAVERIRNETQPVETADIGPCHTGLARFRHLGWQLAVECELTHKEGRPAIHETLGDAIVQSI